MTRTVLLLFAASSALAAPQLAVAQETPAISQEDTDCFVDRTCDFEVRGALTKAEQEEECLNTGRCAIGNEKLVVLVKPKTRAAQPASSPSPAQLTQPARKAMPSAAQASAPKARVIPQTCTPSVPNAMNMCLSFAAGSAELSPSAKAQIDVFAGSLKKSPTSGNFKIEGHTDSSGTAEQNAELSRRRAESVVSYLVAQGVPASRLAAEGFGFSRPKPGLQSNNPLNRRVEIVHN